MDTIRTRVRNIFLEEAKEYRSEASNYYLFALGSKTDEESKQFEQQADNCKKTASLLEEVAAMFTDRKEK